MLINISTIEADEEEALKVFAGKLNMSLARMTKDALYEYKAKHCDDEPHMSLKKQRMIFKGA